MKRVGEGSGAVIAMLLVLLAGPTHAQTPPMEPSFIRLPGPNAGPVWALAALDDGGILAGAASYFTLTGGMYASYDGGSTWRETGLTGLLETEVSAVAASSKSHWIAGLRYLNALTPGGVYVTTDAGASWTASDLELPPIFLEVTQEGVLAGTTNGLYESLDRGLTWSLVNFEGAVVYEIATSGATRLVATSESLYAEDDGGWRSVETGVAPVRSVAITADGRWLAGSSEGVIASVDEGASWVTEIDVPLVYELATCGAGLLALTSEGVFIRDVDTSWSMLAAIEAQDAACTVDGVFVAGVGGVYKVETSGGARRVGIPNETIVELVPTPEMLVASTRQGVRVSRDGGQSWSDAGLNSLIVSHLALGDSIWYAATAVERGLYFRPASGGLWTQTGPYVLPSDIATSGSGGRAIFAGFNLGEVYLLDAAANDWQKLSHQLLDESFVVAAEMRGDTLLLGTLTGVLLSEDGGATWRRERPPFERSHVEQVAIGPDAYYAASEKRLCRKVFGRPWEIMLEAEDQILDVYVSPTELLVAAARAGVYRWRPETGVWQALREGLHSPGPVDVFVRSVAMAGDDTLFAGSAHHGLFRLMLPSTVRAREPVSRTELDISCYPRPASTAISCRMRGLSAAPAEARLYDVVGRDLGVVFRTPSVPTGQAEFDFEVRQAPGLYVLVLQVGSVRAAEKVIVIR